MGCRILYDPKVREACFYCSTSGWAFGPTFSDGGTELGHRDGSERAEAFLRWLERTDTWPGYAKHSLLPAFRRDPRQLTNSGFEAAVSDWLAQEHEQYAEEKS